MRVYIFIYMCVSLFIYISVFLYVFLSLVLLLLLLLPLLHHYHLLLLGYTVDLFSTQFLNVCNRMFVCAHTIVIIDNDSNYINIV